MTTNTTPAIIPARLEQIRQFLDNTRFKDAELRPLAGDASFRRYIRLHKDGETAMLMDAPPEKEDVRPFMAVAEYLHSKGYSAPAIHASHAPHGLLLLEDLGDDSFTLVLRNADEARRGEIEQELYASAIDLLAEWHDEVRCFSNPQSLRLPVYGEELLMREINLFADWYLPQVLGKEKAALLKPDYVTIWKTILPGAALSTKLWVHRDYHADNLMWLPGRAGAQRVGLLDFQDGVYGDAAYDLVSLLEDARRDVPQALVEKMLDRYIIASGADRAKFLTAYAVLGAQRNSKIIGIFSRLAARDSKFHYLNYLPRVWGHLERDLAHPVLAPLKQWIDRHILPEQRGIIGVKHTSQDLALTA